MQGQAVIRPKTRSRFAQLVLRSYSIAGAGVRKDDGMACGVLSWLGSCIVFG